MTKKNKFLFLPHKPVILKKTFNINNKSVEKKFLFHSTEEKRNHLDPVLHKFTIYFCELTEDEKNQRNPFAVNNNYSIVVETDNEEGVVQESASLRFGDCLKSPIFPEGTMNPPKIDFIVRPTSCGLGG